MAGFLLGGWNALVLLGLIQNGVDVVHGDLMKYRPAMDFDVGSKTAIAHAHDAFDRNLTSTLLGALVQGAEHFTRLRTDTGLAAALVDADIERLLFHHGLYMKRLGRGVKLASWRLMGEKGAPRNLVWRHTTMSGLPKCPKCDEDFTYEDGAMLMCPMCGHEWAKDGPAAEDSAPVVRDSVGNPLSDGDTVTVIKDLKVKGSSSVVKVGTKVKDIRLVDGDHDIDCKVPGIGQMGLKSEFVKKA